jgi:hypothetical protein
VQVWLSDDCIAAATTRAQVLIVEKGRLRQVLDCCPPHMIGSKHLAVTLSTWQRGLVVGGPDGVILLFEGDLTRGNAPTAAKLKALETSDVNTGDKTPSSNLSSRLPSRPSTTAKHGTKGAGAGAGAAAVSVMSTMPMHGHKAAARPAKNIIYGRTPSVKSPSKANSPQSSKAASAVAEAEEEEEEEHGGEDQLSKEVTRGLEHQDIYSLLKRIDTGVATRSVSFVCSLPCPAVSLSLFLSPRFSPPVRHRHRFFFIFGSF